MLAARDNKHNIVEKLLELGAVVTDRDKASTLPHHSPQPVQLIQRDFRDMESIFLITQGSHQFVCRFVSLVTSSELTFLTHILITRNVRQNIRGLAQL